MLKPTDLKRAEQADQVLKLLLLSFPTVHEFCEMEHIVAKHGYMVSKEAGLSEKDAERHIVVLQGLKWIREELY